MVIDNIGEDELGDVVVVVVSTLFDDLFFLSDSIVGFAVESRYVDVVEDRFLLSNTILA